MKNKYYQLVELPETKLDKSKPFVLVSSLNIESAELNTGEYIFPDFKKVSINGSVSVYNLNTLVINN